MIDLWYGTSGPRDATIAIVGESWGGEEERKLRPFVGRSGEFLTQLLAKSGINREQCFLTNVVAEHPADNKIERFFWTTAQAKEQKATPWRGCFPKPETMVHIRRMHAQLAAVKPKVIIALGNWALWALTDCPRIKNETVTVRRGKFSFKLGSFKVPTGIMQWRGSQLEWTVGEGAMGCPLVPTIHPAAIVRGQFYLIAPVKHDLSKRVLGIANNGPEKPGYNFVVRPVFRQAVEWLSSRLGKKRWSIDIETRAGHIACVGLATSPTDAICIPFMCVEKPEGYWNVDEEAKLRGIISRILTDPQYEVVGQNFVYDMQYFHRYFFINPRLNHDTMIAQRLLWPGTPLSLYYQASLYCRYYRYWKDEGKEWEEGIDEEQLWRYNCVDCVTTWEIAEVQKRLILSLGFSDQMVEQMEINDLGYEMMNRGIAVNEHTRQALTFDVMSDMMDVEHKLESVIPEDLKPLLVGKTAKASPWYTSPTQQGRLFYDLIGIREVTDKETGNRTCDEAAIEKIRLREPLVDDICSWIQEERTYGVWLNSFLLKSLDKDKRMRCLFKPMPSTFRWASSENAFGSGTNMQNIPRGEDS